MFDEGFLQKLRERYSQIHPLIFHRSVERAISKTDLFDILDSFPTEYPVVWDDSERKWTVTKDLLQISKFDLRTEKK
jgi:hypothetical protein